MSRPATGSRALLGGPPWWLAVAVPVGMVLALFVLRGKRRPSSSGQQAAQDEPGR